MSALSSTALDLAAQPATPVRPGSRVRVTAPQLVAPVIGSFQAIRGDTLVLLEEGPSAGIWTVPTSTIQRFEISAGTVSGDFGRATKFALIGGVGGALVGLLTATILQNSSGDRYNKGVSAGVGAGVGALVMGIVGYPHPHEGWTSVALPRIPVASSRPDRSRTGSHR